ncbi:MULTISPECIES: ABC transporter substrate-binding protein [Streptomyces]|uniref:ABC transporter substrate-binding protein n=1 Tax=Streptomyces TaxID=1883 RepID=UPI000D49AEA2|nr:MULTISPECIES: ABC transporter substrate-binding protein [Streptomyces]PPS70988.1 hypothetical protein BV882_22875 [Streptomyces sp. 46]
MDPDGAWTGIFVDAFSTVCNVDKAGSNPPGSARDLLDPRWKGKIVSTYSNDDDAVLYLCKTIGPGVDRAPRPVPGPICACQQASMGGRRPRGGM